MNEREVAWRVFAGEFNDGSHVITGTGDRAPNYLLTPMGAQINRVFAVGLITDVETIGSDDEPMQRARLSDPTGTFYISAGQYQPEASKALSELDFPAFVAVVGKMRTYSPEEGTLYVSIRPEAIKKVDKDTRERWLLESAKSISARIDAMSEALKMENVSVDELVKLGTSQKIAEGVEMAIEQYGRVDVNRYRAMLYDVLSALTGNEQQMAFDTDIDVRPQPENKEVEMKDRSSEEEPADDGSGPASEGSDDNDEDEERVLALIESNDKDGKGAEWETLVKAADKNGIDKKKLEDIVEDLLDDGMVYEPILGTIKKA